jgi:predicted dehydrogenase
VVSRKLIEHGIHVLKEKPFALSSKEAEELQSLAKKNNVKLMISTQKRFFPAYVKCKEMIMNGVLGSISCIDVRYTLAAVKPQAGNWRTKQSADIVLDMGYHMLDIITWLFGVPEEVYGLTNQQDHYQSVEAGDTCCITFRKVFDGGKAAIGNIFLATYFHEKQEYLTIIGTKGSIVIKAGQEIKHLGPDRTLISEESLPADPHQIVLQQFMEDIDISDQSPLNRPSSSDQVLTMKFVDMLRNSMKS